MALSGTFIINAWSVDNGSGSTSYWSCGSLPSGTCYSTGNASAFGRGWTQANITLNYSVNNSGLLTISYNSTSYVRGPWYVCSVNGYTIDVDFSTDGNNWTNIMHSHANNWPTCVADNNHKVENIASVLCAGLTPVTLTQSGFIRARMWTPNACPTCNGIPASSVWPNAFPSDAASIATAVPIFIEIDYRPGKILDNNSVWQSHNRSGGADNIYNGSTWNTMETSAGGSGQGNPPTIRHSSSWYNQRKIGANS